MRRAYADRNTYVGDPDFVKVPLAGLLDPAYLAKRRASIDPDHATPSARGWNRDIRRAARASKPLTFRWLMRKATRSR